MSDVDQALTELVHSGMTFAAELEIEILSGTKSTVIARAPWSPKRTTSGGAMHGGCLMAIADTVGALCAVLNLPEGAWTSTIESKTNFFRPFLEGNATVTATLVHAGRRTIVVQTDITNADGKLITRTSQTQAVLDNQ